MDSLLFFLQEIRNTKEKQKGETSVIEEADPEVNSVFFCHFSVGFHFRLAASPKEQFIL